MVSVLCAAPNSIYHSLDCEVYDKYRDARSFTMDTPVIAHPPCRAWSAFCAHQAKPEPGEKELGLWCCDVLKQCGGVLEQPAHSRLFAAGGLPLPGQRHGELWSMYVQQAWWGFPIKKATWLCFCGIDKRHVEIPYVLRYSTGDGKRFNRMSKHQRAATCEPFARWLIDIAGHAVLGAR